MSESSPASPSRPRYSTVPPQLGSYVYGLEDPRNGELFYVGRGINDRCLQHARAKLDRADASDKLQRIREIQRDCGCEPRVVIIRYGLPKDASAVGVAAEIEAAVIDVLMRWKVPLTNLVRGAGVSRGLRSLESLQAELEAAPLILPDGEKAMIVNISRTWTDGMSDDEVWEASRCWWVAKPEAQRPLPTLLLGVADGIIRGAWKLPWERFGSSLVERRVLSWDDLDPARQAIYGDPASFKTEARCRFVAGDVDAETKTYVGKQDRLLGRSYGSAFRYWPPG